MRIFRVLINRSFSDTCTSFCLEHKYLWIRLSAKSEGVDAWFCWAPFASCGVAALRGKRVIAAPCSGTVDSMRSIFKQQHCSVVNDYICIPVVMFKRNCKKAVLFLRKLASQPLLLYTVFWTLMLAATVTVAALSLEMGFSAAISPHMEIAEACALQSNKGSPSCRQCFRLPLDGPRDALCVPANMFKKSGTDFAVPPIFAALVVTASAFLVQSLGLWSY